MLIVLSPAKKLLEITKPYTGTPSQPLLVDQANILAKLMKTKSVNDIASLMDLSKDLAELNYHRYQTFDLNKKGSSHSYPALFLFQGDVYQGLNAANWDQKTVDYSQNHLRILSGLYGLLKPLDYIQPYRLEMGVRLENPSGKNLYDFWQEIVTQSLNEQLAVQKNPILVNLASTEYFKVVNEKNLKYPVITINFYEKKNEQLKMVGIHAKKARGTMAKFLMQNQIDDVKNLKQFKELGYEFQESTSTETHVDFVRDSR